MTHPGASDKNKSVLHSMLVLAGLIGASVISTALVTSYLRAQDPVNQCVTRPLEQPYQLSVPLIIFEDGVPAVARDVGVTPECIRPVHTLQDNVIHVGYTRQHDFTLGHFFYYWLGDDILRYDVKVYVNGTEYPGDFRDIVLKQGDEIRIELATRNQ
ncbi:MAG TPA: hypothetical protein VJL54_08915 [Nitrososphaera sp.]|nr:hypothetical protein [Nitrososphaera sp.]